MAERAVVINLTAVPTQRPAWADIDLSAIAHNARELCGEVAPAALLAVVKANGYGHGAVAVSQAALSGGATWLGVALVEEGIALRNAGIEAPVLVLSEPAPAAMADVVRFGLTPTCYTPEGLAAAAQAAESAGGGPLPVHVKVDTGMHRVGATPDAAAALVAQVRRHPYLTLGGVFTHLAVADELDNAYTGRQLEQFSATVATLGERPPLLHAANSAGALWHPAGRFDLVRCGIALYGLAPSADQLGTEVVGRLRPAMSLRARVSFVKTLDAGARMSYGLRYELAQRSVVATVPLGYADGVPRRLAQQGGEVLIGGRRCPIAGTVTMDQILVDCGPRASVAPGDEVVLLGTQRGADGRDATIGAWEWAQRTGTIAYEVVCGISERVPRRHG